MIRTHKNGRDEKIPQLSPLDLARALYKLPIGERESVLSMAGDLEIRLDITHSEALELLGKLGAFLNNHHDKQR
jgi:hypothetical protein